MLVQVHNYDHIYTSRATLSFMAALWLALFGAVVYPQQPMFDWFKIYPLYWTNTYCNINVSNLHTGIYTCGDMVHTHMMIILHLYKYLCITGVASMYIHTVCSCPAYGPGKSVFHSQMFQNIVFKSVVQLSNFAWPACVRQAFKPCF